MGTRDSIFFQLTVDKVLETVEKDGLRTNTWCLPYHCLENRVYEIGLDLPKPPENPSEGFRIAKFYRPGRWTKEQIQEEHIFLQELQDQEIPVVAPLPFPDGETLHQVKDTNIYYCLFPKIGGRNLYELQEDQLEILGRLLARIHRVGASKPFKHRLSLTPEMFATNNLKYLIDAGHVPEAFKSSFTQVVEDLVKDFNPLFAKVKPQRVHGDCHLGNVLVRNDLPYFVDFDDSMMGPPVRDLWLLLSARDQETRIQREIFLEAYEEMNSFDRTSLRLIEPLRALRMINYTAWVMKRFDDPIFGQTFQHFKADHYWAQHIQDLRDIKQMMQESSPY